MAGGQQDRRLVVGPSRLGITHNEGMLLRGVGVRRAVRSTVILGAGASRGASFAGTARQVLPPVDADFFRQAQRLDEQSFRGVSAGLSLTL
jgi:hypothetical protein